jgi:hypothetical protein
MNKALLAVLVCAAVAAEKHLLDRLNRVIAWYDKYLKPAPPSTAQ